MCAPSFPTYPKPALSKAFLAGSLKGHITDPTRCRNVLCGHLCADGLHAVPSRWDHPPGGATPPRRGGELGVLPVPCLPRRDTVSGICFITICHAKGFSCSILQANFRNLFSPSDIDSWGSLQAAWNEKSMVTAAEWAPFFINLELRAAPALSPPSGITSSG